MRAFVVLSLAGCAFDVATIPASCDVTRARVLLYFFQDDFTGVSPTFSAHRVTTAWAAAQTTWNAPWASPGGDYAAHVESSNVMSPGAFGWIAWDVTAVVTAWRTGTANYGVEILEANDDPANMGRKEFYSSRAAANHPYLEITCN